MTILQLERTNDSIDSIRRKEMRNRFGHRITSVSDCNAFEPPPQDAVGTPEREMDDGRKTPLREEPPDYQPQTL
jgi:hypothetical protein